MMSACLDCNKPIDHKATRCLPCYDVARRFKAPANFAEIITQNSQERAAELLGMSVCTIKKLQKQHGIERTRIKRPPIPTPAWFKDDAPGMTRKEAVERAGVSDRTIAKWEAETGSRCVRHAPKKAVAPVVIFKRADVARAEQAARFLQKIDAIWKCNADRQASPGGSYWWWYGRARTPVEIIEIATGKGFDPDAWKRVSQPRAFGEIAQGVLARCEVRV